MPHRTHPFAATIAAFAFAAALLAAPRPASAASCVKWQGAMAQGRIAMMPDGKAVQVRQFDDFTKIAGDEWLSFGIRNYIADLMSSAKKGRIFSGITAKHGGAAYDFTVDGMYQHLDGNLRVFIKLSEGSGGRLIAQKEVIFPYPDNSEFFSKIAAATEELLKQMDIPYDSEMIKTTRSATGSTRAYESYSRGRNILEQFTLSAAAEAMPLFTETKRIDYQSPLGYQGIAEANDFLGLYNKLAGKPYEIYFQRAEAEFAQMMNVRRTSPVFGYLKYKPQARSKSIDMKDRFVLGNASYREGVAAAGRADYKAAAEAFRRSAQFVPEDATAWQRLANAESMLGKTKEAGEAQNRAAAVDPCAGNP